MRLLRVRTTVIDCPTSLEDNLDLKCTEKELHLFPPVHK